MPQFEPRKIVETTEPTVTVEGLRPGRYSFRLVVIDAHGNRSKAVAHALTVVERRRPAPPLQPIGGGAEPSDAPEGGAISDAEPKPRRPRRTKGKA